MLIKCLYYFFYAYVYIRLLIVEIVHISFLFLYYLQTNTHFGIIYFELLYKYTDYEFINTG